MNRSARSARRTVSGFVLAATLLAAAACSSTGEGLNPVTGKVLYKGQPTPGAVVTFHPEGAAKVDTVTSTGVAGDDGTFTLTTGGAKGAKAGKYVVTVIWPDPKKQTPGKVSAEGMGVEVPDVLGGRYMARDGSKLSAEVKAGENKLEPFDLK